MKNLTTRVPNYMQIYFPYSTVTSACQGSRLTCTRTVSIFRMPMYIKMCFRHQKQTILHRYRNEINTVNQSQLNQSTNVNLMISWFMKSLCVITIKLNTLMSHTKWRWLGHLFTYVKTCERRRVKDFEQRSRVYTI